MEQIQVHRTTPQQSTVSKGHHNVKETFRSHADYFIHGVKICRSTFQFIYCLSDKSFRNLTQHYDMNGLVTRVHRNSKRLPHNVLTLENTEKVTAFTKNYASAHGLPLPGRVPGHRNKETVLPANHSKVFVYRKYQEACSNSNTCVSTVGRPKFYDMWASVLPFISISTPSSDLCFTCQQLSLAVQKSFCVSEEEKLRRMEEHQEHLQRAKKKANLL